MVGDDRAGVAALGEGPHYLRHIDVALCGEGLDKALGQRLPDVAEVDLEQFLLAGEMADRLGHVLAGPLASLDPRPDTQADADVRAIGDLQGPHVAGEVAENAPR